MTATNLDLMARSVLDEVMSRLDADRYFTGLEERYRKAAEPVVTDQGREPRIWSDEDRARIRFEALVYMSARLLDLLPSYLTRRKLLGGHEPDGERIESFRAGFLKYFPERMSAAGLGAMDFPAMGRLPAHRVTALDRLREYERLAKTGRAQDSFVGFLGHAMDPQAEIVTNIVALESIQTIVKEIRDVLGSRFG